MLFLLLTASIISISCAAFSGDTAVHDPSFIKSGSCYYIFSTGDASYNSGNAQIRKTCNDAVSRIGAEFSATPTWIKGVIGSTPGNIWAPDINNFGGKWWLYYAGSTFGTSSSAIGVGSATNIEGPYTDHGEVIHTTSSSNYNAIDPEIAWTITNGSRGDAWLVFGSFWDGIKMRKLDTSTGKLSTSDTTLHSLASRSGGAVEAASMAWKDNYYYLFVSFDTCCKGVDSTYNIRVGRASTITGPYKDKAGTDMMKGGGTQLLATHGTVHGPGGQDVYLDGDVYRMVFHWYDGNDSGKSKMEIVDLGWSDGWPTIGSESKLKYS